MSGERGIRSRESVICVTTSRSGPVGVLLDTDVPLFNLLTDLPRRRPSVINVASVPSTINNSSHGRVCLTPCGLKTYRKTNCQGDSSSKLVYLNSLGKRNKIF